MIIRINQKGNSSDPEQPPKRNHLNLLQSTNVFSYNLECPNGPINIILTAFYPFNLISSFSYKRTQEPTSKIKFLNASEK